MLLAFIGVTLIAGEPRYEDDLISILLVVGGAFTWAVGQIMIKTLGVVIINLRPAGSGSRAQR
jgi:drug/metabolite transporter (DMT)-like permease